MNDIVKKYNAKTGYTHSYEISLIFPPICTNEKYDQKVNKSTRPYDGRVIKLCTVMVGYCSVRFAYHIANLVNENKYQYIVQFLKKINQFQSCFDARILAFLEELSHEGTTHMIW